MSGVTDEHGVPTSGIGSRGMEPAAASRLAEADAADAPGVSGPLTVAVTGGIGSGKSTVSAMLAEHGAVLVDSDALAREVVAPGSAGLAAVAAAFGPQVLTAAGALDRAAMAGIVFADPDARRTLESITHPLVRRAFAARRDAAAGDAVVVNDIPILRDLPVAASFHLVVGVGAPDAPRLDRLVARGMSAEDATSRIAAQIGDDERRRLCDAWVDNDGDRDDLAAAVGALWSERLLPFSTNRLAGRRAPRSSGPMLADPDPAWPGLARLIGARVSAAADGARVDHIGSTAIPGLAAKDVIDLQVTVADLATADRLDPALTGAGFPRLAGIDRDTPHPPGSDPGVWAKRLHGTADPLRPVNLHLRVQGSPGWRWALLFPAWLRSEPAVREEYLELKREVATRFASGSIADYAEAKEPWMAQAYPRGLAWADRTGWSP